MYYDDETQELVVLQDFYEGGSLAKMVEFFKSQNLKIPEEKIIKWITQACQGVNYLHSRKIRNLNIKLSNILLDSAENAIVGDFAYEGIMTSRKSGNKTNLGTYGYIAPEVLKGFAVDNQIDVWSLGCLLYELCCYKVFLKSNLFLVKFLEYIQLK